MVRGFRGGANGVGGIDRRGVIISGLTLLAGCGGGGSSGGGGGTPAPSPTPTPTPSPTSNPADALNFDVVVYGSNVAGLAALMRAGGRRGRRVCIIEPYTKFGGIHAAGLSHVDYADATLIGGDVSSRYLGLIASYAGATAGRWDFEPKQAQLAAETLISRYAAASSLNAPVETNQVMTEATAQGTRIKGIQTTAGLVTGKVFIDASYEGDLMAGALGPNGYTFGRESASEHNEATAGYLAGRSQLGTVAVGLSPPADYPYLPDPNLAKGDADDRYQAYNFRLPLTRNAANRIPFNKPSGYDTSLYSTQLRFLAALGYTKFARDRTTQSIGFQAALPNGKVNWNGLDMLNGNVGYADGDWAKRRQIVEAHNTWQQGLMWCIANDPIAANYGLGALQADAADCGLCADEFPDSPYGAGWPFWLYVREGRRLKAIYKMTAGDLTPALGGGSPTKATSIGQWKYAWDIHLVQGFYKPADRSRVYVEGDPLNTGQPTAVYDIPAECMLPPKASCINLIVPTCAGFSHVAWGAHRMEVAQGICGEAAGEIAAWACETQQPVQDYSYSTIKQRLTQYGTVL